ncbi:YoaK family protein [Erwinia oleae]|uniref:YoaK family protein n=1 Tax=Erwinia oleae TaxID=796334 RepID=UPI00054DAF12|nr:YoaK family protein [Erwinia oleae]
MLIHTDTDRTPGADSWLACLLAAVAGALNTAAFEIVGFFSANMTGNLSSLSDNLAKVKWSSGGFFLALVLLFITGATLATLIVNAGRRRNMRGIYAFVILIEATALIVLGTVEITVPLASPGIVLIMCLSLLMGLQNAVVTRISNARVRTTHISGTATDIGIELAMMIDIVLRRESPKQASPFIERLKLHGLTLFGFFVGGVTGILAWNLLGYAFLIVTGGLLIFMAMLSLQRARKHASSAKLLDANQ